MAYHKVGYFYRPWGTYAETFDSQLILGQGNSNSVYITCPGRVHIGLITARNQSISIAVASTP